LSDAHRHITTQVASLAKLDAILVRPIIVSFLVAFIINAALASRYFLAVPLVMTVVIALCLAIALGLASRAQTDKPGASSDKPGLV
jgi:hypothetical protein